MARRFLVLIAAVLLLLSGPGCVVTTSSYEMKVREADALREALASMNREKAKLVAENSALAAKVASCEEKSSALSGRVRELEAAPPGPEGLTAAPPELSGTIPVTRDRLIDELLDREMAAGKQLQQLNERTERCEKELERMRRETAAAGR